MNTGHPTAPNFDPLRLAVATLAAAAGMAFAGPLDPPSGAIQPTYKTLAEIEGRTAINAVNTPGDADSLFKITQPGSYYLAGNVVGVPGPKVIGIEVTVGNVTIDLNGFVVDGQGQLKTGVLLSGVNNALRNGSVRNLSQGRGVWITSAYAIVEDVRTIDTAGVGFDIDADNATLRRISVSSALGGVDGTNADALTIQDSILSENFDFGIIAGTRARVEGCVVDGIYSGIGAPPLIGIRAGDSSSVRDSRVFINVPGVAAYGIHALDGVQVDACNVHVNSSTASLVALNGTGNSVTNCKLSGNTGSGVGVGISLISGTNRSRIEQNSIDSVATGVNFNNCVFNVVIRNTINATVSLALWSDSSNTVGPLVSTTQENGLTNPLANLTY